MTPDRLLRARLRSSVPRATLLVAALALLSLTAAAAKEKIPCVWTGVQRVIAVGDIHGDLENFVAILRGNGLIDEAGRWTGGTAHLVQNGDIIDKGPSAREIFDLVMRLETEAAAAGGRVHILLGNHEEANVTGIALDYPDYVPAEQFVAFLKPEYRAKKEKEFLAALPPGETRPSERVLNLSENYALRRFWERVMKTVEGRAAYTAGFSSPYGDWLLRKNAVIKINDVVFVHGGISEKFASWPLQKINDTLREEMAFVRDQIRVRTPMPPGFRPRIVYDPQGPLWYRDLALMDEDKGLPQVERILVALGASEMVIAHTYTRNGGGSPVISPATISRFQGRVWTIDTGISSYYGGALSALRIEDGAISIWGPGPAPSPVAPAGAETPLTSAPDKVEEFLRTAPVAAVKREALPGRTDVWTVSLRNGAENVRAVFKSIDRRRPSVLPDSYAYELAAYALSKALGLNLVPPAVERTIEERPGSLQVFVEGAVPLRDLNAGGRVPTTPAFMDALETLTVFENLVFSFSEDEADVFVGTADRSVRRVDFSEAFAPAPQLLPGHLPRRCPKALFLKLAGFDEAAARAAAGAWLNDDEVRALDRRRELILARLRSLIETQGEPAVLF